jgi:hypothetical protein
VDVHAKLNELRNLVENARSMPMSSSCVVNRTEILGLVGDLHRQLPAEMHDALRILDDKEAVIDEGRSEAKRLIEQALKDRERLFSDHEVYRVAREQAEEVVAGARTEADALRREVDDYVD